MKRCAGVGATVAAKAVNATAEVAEAEVVVAAEAALPVVEWVFLFLHEGSTAWGSLSVSLSVLSSISIARSREVMSYVPTRTFDVFVPDRVTSCGE